MLFSTLNKLKSSKQAKLRKPTYREGTQFPSHVSINLVSSQKLAKFKADQSGIPEEGLRGLDAIKFDIDELRQLYSDRQKIVLLYPFPATLNLSMFAEDPL